MRAWYQSATSLGADPVWKPYEESLKRRCREVARAGSTIDVRGVKAFAPRVPEVEYFEYLNTVQIIENAVRAEQEGYDAFMVGCMLDPGFLEIRQAVSIPVAFAAETAFYAACLLAPKFALLTFGNTPATRWTRVVRECGLESRMMLCDPLDITMATILVGFKDPAPVVRAVEVAANKATRQGAGILISMCNVLNMVLVDHHITEIAGVPIMDSVAGLVKMTELLLDLEGLHIARSKKGPYASVPKEERSLARRLYGLE